MIRSILILALAALAAAPAAAQEGPALKTAATVAGEIVPDLAERYLSTTLFENLVDE